MLLTDLTPDVDAFLDDFMYAPLGQVDVPGEDDLDPSTTPEVLELRGWIYRLSMADGGARDDLVYVGATTARVRTRLRSHHRSLYLRRHVDFNWVKAWHIADARLMWSVERALIETLQPPANRQYTDHG